jgi:hypothetical protein
MGSKILEIIVFKIKNVYGNMLKTQLLYLCLTCNFRLSRGMDVSYGVILQHPNDYTVWTKHSFIFHKVS